MDTELGEVQKIFANIIWESEPVSSGELVRICEEKLSWKKSTTYTVLRKLCEKGLFQNQDGIVTSLISKEDFCCEEREVCRRDVPRFIAFFYCSIYFT